MTKKKKKPKITFMVTSLVDDSVPCQPKQTSTYCITAS